MIFSDISVFLPWLVNGFVHELYLIQCVLVAHARLYDVLFIAKYEDPPKVIGDIIFVYLFFEDESIIIFADDL